MPSAAYADAHQREGQVENLARGGAMDVAPVRVAAPRESVVTQNHHSLDSVHGATASEQNRAASHRASTAAAPS